MRRLQTAMHSDFPADFKPPEPKMSELKPSQAKDCLDGERVTIEELSTFRSQLSALALDADGGLDELSDDNLPSSIGRFKILKRLGSGDFGCVYLAYDSRLTRHVAIKVSHFGGHMSGALRDRFIREAHAAARLAHQNVVCLHEYGEELGVLYLVYEMCQGPTLAEWLAARSEPVPIELAAGIVRDIANGLAHAHLRGLVHRDVKPNNVLLAPNQDASSSLPFIPRITDFGLAHDSLSLEQKSISARLVGTVDFMSPEQARGDLRNVSPASDQYSLGVILYQLLTGKLPFENADFVQHLQRICREQPRSPRGLRRDVPRDLAAITLTCLSKSPEGRYASCRDLARDLERFLRSAPVHARPLRAYQHAWRTVCASPIVSSLVGLIMVGCLVSALVFSRMAGELKIHHRELEQTLENLTVSESIAVQARHETERALLVANQQRDQAEQHARQAVEQAYRADLYRAYEAWSKRQVLETIQLLDSIEDHTAEFMKPGTDFRLLANATRTTVIRLASHTFPATDIKPIRGTPWVVSADHGGYLFFHHADSGELVHSIRVMDGAEINAIDVSLDGSQIAVGGRGRLLGLNYANVYPLKCGDDRPWLGNATASYFSPTVVESLRFSPDASLLAVGPRYLPVMLYDCQTKKLRRTLPTKSRNRTVDFSPDGQHCLVVDDAHRLLIYDAHSGEVTRTVACSETAQLARWSPTGEWIAYGQFSDATVHLVATTPPYRSIQLPQAHGTIESISFSDDGRWLAAGTRRGGVVAWSLAGLSDSDTIAELLCRSRAVAHHNDVTALHIDRQGQITSVGDSGCVVSVRTADSTATPLGENVVAANIDLRHDRQYIIRGLRDGRVTETQTATGMIRELVAAGASPVTAITCDSKHHQVAVGWDDGRIAVIDLSSGMYTDYAYPVPSDSLDMRRIKSLAFNEGGTQLAVCGDDARLRVWNIGQSEQPLWEHRLSSMSEATCFCGTDRLAVGGVFEEVIVLDSTSGEVVQRIAAAQRTQALIFDAVRKRLISGHVDGRIRIYEGQGYMLRHTLNADAGEIKSLCCSPDNTCYLSGDNKGNVKLWNADQCEFVGDLHLCPSQSSIAGLLWNVTQPELQVILDGPSRDGIEGLRLRSFSAR